MTADPPLKSNVMDELLAGHALLLYISTAIRLVESSLMVAVDFHANDCLCCVDQIAVAIK